MDYGPDCYNPDRCTNLKGCNLGCMSAPMRYASNWRVLHKLRDVFQMISWADTDRKPYTVNMGPDLPPMPIYEFLAKEGYTVHKDVVDTMLDAMFNKRTSK